MYLLRDAHQQCSIDKLSDNHYSDKGALTFYWGDSFVRNTSNIWKVKQGPYYSSVSLALVLVVGKKKPITLGHRQV